MKYSLLAVILIKNVEDTSRQEGGGKEYMHTLDHSIFLHFSSVMLNFPYKPHVCAITQDKGMGKYKT
jgi:hypothetical protein